jgi:hypothetical protein
MTQHSTLTLDKLIDKVYGKPMPFLRLFNPFNQGGRCRSSCPASTLGSAGSTRFARRALQSVWALDLLALRALQALWALALHALPALQALHALRALYNCRLCERGDFPLLHDNLAYHLWHSRSLHLRLLFIARMWISATTLACMLMRPLCPWDFPSVLQG